MIQEFLPLKNLIIDLINCNKCILFRKTAESKTYLSRYKFTCVNHHKLESLVKFEFDVCPISFTIRSKESNFDIHPPLLKID